jgi:hypothetical protein
MLISIMAIYLLVGYCFSCSWKTLALLYDNAADANVV